MKYIHVLRKHCFSCFSFKRFKQMVQRYLLRRMIVHSFLMIFDSVPCQIFPAKLRLCQFPISPSATVLEIVLKYDGEQVLVVFRPFPYFDEQVVICASPPYSLIVDVSLRYMSVPCMNKAMLRVFLFTLCAPPLK